MIELGLKGDHPVTAQLEFFEGAIQFQFDAGDALFQLHGLGNLKFVRPWIAACGPWNDAVFASDGV